MRGLVIASVCLLVGLALGVCVSTVARAYGRKHDALPARDEAVNVFRGVVFPAPHDPRWRKVQGKDVFEFSDRGILLEARWLTVHCVCIVTTDENPRVTDYFVAVRRCYYDFRMALALQQVEPAILNAGFAKDEKPTADGVPERRETPQLVAIAAQQQNAAGLYDIAAQQRDMANVYRLREQPPTSPVFRIDDEHVLPCPSTDGWYHASAGVDGVHIRGGDHLLSVYKDGSTYLNASPWMKHKRAAELYGLVVARLPRKESLADKQRKAADDMLAKLSQMKATER